jgi:RimJ/RimL family protein N-acetyltransferase
MPLSFLEACLRGDTKQAEALLGLHIPSDWLQEVDLIKARLAELLDDPACAMWGLRAVAINASRMMIGHVGFHSVPNPDYLQPYWPYAVELEYTIYARYRRMGHAREAVAGLMRWAARRAPIRRFLVSVAAANLASRGLARKLGFVKTEEYFDDESCERYLVYVLQGKSLARLISGRG